MRLIHFLQIGLGLTFAVGTAHAQFDPVKESPGSSRLITTTQTTNDLGLITNGPVVAHAYKIIQSWTNITPILNPVVATNPFFMKRRQSSYTWTNAVFQHFIPESLSYVIWTNFLTLTNGRDLSIWSERRHPDNWPTNNPVVRWNTNSVMWGMKGLTALSPCWEGEGSPGQVPLTALTRRHAYTRGHGMGPEGLNTLSPRRKAWFLTRGNSLVEVNIQRYVTRASSGTNGVHRDYTIVLFDRDLPEAIEQMRVATLAEVQSRYPFPTQWNCPHPIFQTEQGGYLSTGIAPMVVNTWKPGDSGSPNMVPLPGELVFFSGRSTSGPSPEMQEDMDALCRLEGLDPKKYQLRHADLSKYPGY